jgi:hypothetical protein
VLSAFGHLEQAARVGSEMTEARAALQKGKEENDGFVEAFVRVCEWCVAFLLPCSFPMVAPDHNSFVFNGHCKL